MRKNKRKVRPNWSKVDSQHSHKLTSEFITPSSLLKALNVDFDLDPCPSNHAQPVAKSVITKSENGLRVGWDGVVFCHPPHHAKIHEWIIKNENHNHSIALYLEKRQSQYWRNRVLTRGQAVVVFDSTVKMHIPEQVLRNEKNVPEKIFDQKIALVSYGDYCTEALYEFFLKCNKNKTKFFDLVTARKQGVIKSILK